jgi:hypothetical protein
MQTNLTTFSFLAIQPKRTRPPTPNNCGLAWIDSQFHLNGNNYFIYTCHSCGDKQIKKGQKPPAINWGGNYV